ncbi:MAG TPA: ABC transporter permease subunit [Syntrophomonadaceae bacterium]|nr:ABC transporter permease subunit [Syntrophomonadaceae bacterium]
MKTATLPVKQYEKDNLTESFLHPGLLWKEWRQHRYLFILFLLLVLQPLGLPIFIQAFGLLSNMSVAAFNPWVWAITNFIQDGGSSMGIAVVLLAAYMVAGERGKSFNFLVSSPVSRRQILMAKWVTGSFIILISMILLLVYMSTIYSLYPTDIAINQILAWAGRTTAALLCLFSLALLSASLCTGILYSAVLTIFFLALLVMVNIIIMFPATKYALLSSHQITQITHWFSYFNLVNIIINELGNGESISLSLVLIIPMLLMASILFLLLAVRAFENNPLERSGEVLLTGSFKEIGRWMIVCLFAPMYAVELADSTNWFIIYTILLAIGIYLGLGWLWRAMAWLGLSRQS